MGDESEGDFAIGAEVHAAEDEEDHEGHEEGEEEGLAVAEEHFEAGEGEDEGGVHGISNRFRSLREHIPAMPSPALWG